MAPDVQLINPAGQPLSREQLLSGVSAGQPDFLDNAPTSEIVVRRASHAAMLRFQRRFELVIGGTGLTHMAWSTVFYERRRGRWLAVSRDLVYKRPA